MVERPSQSTPYEVHPVAALFPMLADDELADLASDIKANGLQSPIVLDGDVLIDGRNRLAACEMAGVEPTFIELNGADPVAFILSANLARRHMTKGQRAMAAAKVLLLNSTPAQAADVVGASRQYVDRARQVLDADSDLADQVLAGTIPLNEAYQEVQDRKRLIQRRERDREILRELAPDLDAQVSEEVMGLQAALDQARELEQKQQAERRDALDLLGRILNLISPDSADRDFVEAWADHLGPVPTATIDKTRKAGQVLFDLAERMITE